MYSAVFDTKANISSSLVFALWFILMHKFLVDVSLCHLVAVFLSSSSDLLFYGI
jgi:hypothetical protein